MSGRATSVSSAVVKRIAESRDRHDVDAPSRRSSWMTSSAFDASARRLFGHRALRATELQRHQAVAVHAAVDMRRVGRRVMGGSIQPTFRCGSTPLPRKRARAWRMKLPVIRFHTK